MTVFARRWLIDRSGRSFVNDFGAGGRLTGRGRGVSTEKGDRLVNSVLPVCRRLTYADATSGKVPRLMTDESVLSGDDGEVPMTVLTGRWKTEEGRPAPEERGVGVDGRRTATRIRCPDLIDSFRIHLQQPPPSKGARIKKCYRKSVYLIV